MSAPVLPPPAVRHAVDIVLARMMALVSAAGDVVGEAVRPAPSTARIDELMAVSVARVTGLGEAMGLLVGVVRAASAPAPPSDEARPSVSALPRGRCPVCGAEVALRKGALARQHCQPRGGSCLGSGMRVAVRRAPPRERRRPAR